MARPSGGHAALSGGEAFCTSHIAALLFDAEMEELVCCEYPTRGRRCPSPLHASLTSILNSLGSPPYHGTSYYRYKLINNTELFITEVLEPIKVIGQDENIIYLLVGDKNHIELLTNTSEEITKI